MNKFDFLTALRAKLWSIPHSDAERTVDYYAEMIDDRMEEGLTEEEAVAAVGNLEEIVADILAQTPRVPVTAQTPKKEKNHQGWMILLLVLGSPLWVPLLAGALATVISVYIGLWSVVISLYAAAVALGVAAIGCVMACFFMIGELGAVPVAIGAALLCAGLGILLFLLANLAAKGLIALTKLCWDGIRKLFQRKEQTV